VEIACGLKLTAQRHLLPGLGTSGVVLLLFTVNLYGMHEDNIPLLLLLLLLLLFVISFTQAIYIYIPEKIMSPGNTVLLLLFMVHMMLSAVSNLLLHFYISAF
jgi:hypothetical protein